MRTEVSGGYRAVNRQTKWVNPFLVEEDGTAPERVFHFECWAKEYGMMTFGRYKCICTRTNIEPGTTLGGRSVGFEPTTSGL